MSRPPKSTLLSATALAEIARYLGLNSSIGVGRFGSQRVLDTKPPKNFPRRLNDLQATCVVVRNLAEEVPLLADGFG